MKSIKEILSEATEKKSTDIHYLPGYPVMCRVDEELIAVDEEVVSSARTEHMAKQILSEKEWELLEETGDVDTAFSLSGFSRIRAHIFRQRGNYAIALRILPEKIPTTGELGIPRAFTILTRKRKGLILVAGTAGTGKSTTMASLVDVIAREQSRNIMTLEDPIEFLHDYRCSMVSQREIGSDCRSYAEALQAALHQDPDVILVGEMMDLDTISTALNAAESGHLIISSVYNNSAAAAIERLIEVFPHHHQSLVRVQLANVLEGIIAQQLLPRLDGSGRVRAYEVMMKNAVITELIKDNRTDQIPDLVRAHTDDGMQTMDDAILELYMKSKISAETAIAYAQNTIEMTQKVSFV